MPGLHLALIVSAAAFAAGAAVTLAAVQPHRHAPDGATLTPGNRTLDRSETR